MDFSRSGMQNAGSLSVEMGHLGTHLVFEKIQHSFQKI